VDVLTILFANKHNRSAIAWDSAGNQEKILFGINCLDLKIFNGYPLVAHVARHLLAFKDMLWKHRANTTRFAMMIGAMTFRSTVEVVSFDNAGKTLTFRSATGRNNITFSEILNSNLVPQLKLGV
jgi:hypothetical protein